MGLFHEYNNKVVYIDTCIRIIILIFMIITIIIK